MTADHGRRMPAAPLAGVRVLVTRPAGQCQGLAAAIEARGGEAVLVPLVEIAEPRDPAAAAAVLARLGEFDLAVFVSRNAVERGLVLAGSPGAFPCEVAAIGEGTAAALRAAGIVRVLVPREAKDSEALLAMPAFSPQVVRGRRVVIVKGEGGRELIGDTLAERGAEVAVADVYRRRRPAAHGLDVLSATAVDAIVITSAESLNNLIALADGRVRARLDQAVVVAISERIAQRVRAAGLGAQSLVADRPDDEALAEAVVAWRLRPPSPSEPVP